MKRIHSFFKKFDALTPPDDALRRIVAKTTSEVLGIEISKSKVRIDRTTAFVALSSVQKHTLRLQRSTVLARIEEEIPGRIRDIR